MKQGRGGVASALVAVGTVRLAAKDAVSAVRVHQLTRVAEGHDDAAANAAVAPRGSSHLGDVVAQVFGRFLNNLCPIGAA